MDAGAAVSDVRTEPGDTGGGSEGAACTAGVGVAAAGFMAGLFAGLERAPLFRCPCDRVATAGLAAATFAFALAALLGFAFAVIFFVTAFSVFVAVLLAALTTAFDAVLAAAFAGVLVAFLPAFFVAVAFGASPRAFPGPFAGLRNPPSAPRTSEWARAAAISWMAWVNRLTNAVTT